MTITAARFGWFNAVVRVAIGLELVASVADRFGLLGGPGQPGVSWGSFGAFLDYVRVLLPSPLVAFASAVGVGATVVELTVGVLLVPGFRRVAVSAAGSILLVAFALAMITSIGVSVAAEYAVIPQAAALLVLAARYRESVSSPQRGSALPSPRDQFDH